MTSVLVFGEDPEVRFSPWFGYPRVVVPELERTQCQGSAWNSTLMDGIMADFMKMIPGMDDAELVQQTACLRPLSADGMPIVDKVTGWDNLFVATGAGRKGILWSTGMAQVMFDLIDTGKSDVDGSDHLKLDRF